MADRAPDLSKVCFDAACPPVTLLEANPDVGWESRHEFDPPSVVSHVWMLQCAEVPCKLGCINTSYAATQRRSTMFRTKADQLNFASRTRSVVEHRYPDEEVLFSTAATILETPHESPTGWSMRRFFQRRGNVVITNARIFVQSSFLSLLTVIWLAVIGYCVYGFSQNGHVFNIILAILAGIFIVQRRPYSRDVSFDSIRRVEFGSVQGMAARCDIVSIVVDGHAVQLVTAQIVPDGIRERLLAFNDSRSVP